MNTSKTLYEMYETLLGFSEAEAIEWYSKLDPENQRLLDEEIEKHEVK